MSEFLDAAQEVAVVLKRTLDAHRSSTARFLVEIVERRVNEILDLFAAEVEASGVTTALLEAHNDEETNA